MSRERKEKEEKFGSGFTISAFLCSPPFPPFLPPPPLPPPLPPFPPSPPLCTYARADTRGGKISGMTSLNTKNNNNLEIKRSTKGNSGLTLIRKALI